MMHSSATRVAGLINDVMDMARSRLGGGLALQRDAAQPLEPVLRGVVAELLASLPDKIVDTEFTFTDPVNCDRSRIAQLFSHLLSNALTYGAVGRPVRVCACESNDGFELSVSNGGRPHSSR